MKKMLVFTAAFSALFFILSSATFAGKIENKNFKNAFINLEKRLVKDGFKKNVITGLFANKKAVFDSEGVSLYFIHNEGSLNYDKFANKTSIWRAKKYIKTHKKDFSKAEKQFGVDKTVITAIILVETGLGTYLGKRPVFNTLASMAALYDKGVRKKLWNSISPEKRLSKKKFQAKANKKSAWAYKELKAFIKYARNEKIGVFDIMGSYAGAMGIAQFMPSNILAYAMDGNGDGSIDLFIHADAIMSIANYLKQFGWHPEIKKKKARKVLFAYNHSSYYVDILMRISKLLKKQGS